jgi:hypothetical protein
MSGEQLTGQDAPVVDNETSLHTEQVNPVVPQAQTDGADGGEKEVPVPKTFTQSELDQIVAREKAKAERKAYRDALKAQHQQPQPEPKREAFVSDEAYTQAQLEHLAERKAAEKLAQREYEREAERRQEAFLEKAEKAAERFPDFQLVVSNPNLAINESMYEFISDSDLGPDIAYFLGKNPMKASAIAQMSPVKAARELVKLESELASRPKATPSKAPEPIKPVGSRGASTSALPSDSDDIETWMRKERERTRKR